MTPARKGELALVGATAVWGLTFAMVQDAVDTAVITTAFARVGLPTTWAGAPFEELHDDLLALLAPGEGLEVHVNLLRHGRRTCVAQRPRCSACALDRMCPKVGVDARA